MSDTKVVTLGDWVFTKRFFGYEIGLSAYGNLPIEFPKSAGENRRVATFGELTSEMKVNEDELFQLLKDGQPDMKLEKIVICDNKDNIIALFDPWEEDCTGPTTVSEFVMTALEVQRLNDFCYHEAEGDNVTLVTYTSGIGTAFSVKVTDTDGPLKDITDYNNI